MSARDGVKKYRNGVVETGRQGHNCIIGLHVDCYVVNSVGPIPTCLVWAPLDDRRRVRVLGVLVRRRFFGIASVF